MYRLPSHPTKYQYDGPRPTLTVSSCLALAPAAVRFLSTRYCYGLRVHPGRLAVPVTVVTHELMKGGGGGDRVRWAAGDERKGQINVQWIKKSKQLT
jgi:hypothetical protein